MFIVLRLHPWPDATRRLIFCPENKLFQLFAACVCHYFNDTCTGYERRMNQLLFTISYKNEAMI